MHHEPRIVVTDVLTEPLTREPAAEVVSGDPHTGVLELGGIHETGVGIWELTEGTVRDTEVDELFVVLSGRARIDFESGETVDLSPGVCVRLREGERTTWTVTETLRKIWIA